MPEVEIGSLTLRQFEALIDRKTADDNRLRLNAGIVAAALYNTAPGDPNRKPVSPLQFVPGMAVQAEQADAKASGAPDMRLMDAVQQRDYLLRVLNKRSVRRK